MTVEGRLEKVFAPHLLLVELIEIFIHFLK